jgi:hypothetical protein
MPVCDSVASRILCLPLYHTLTLSDLDFICRILLKENLKSKTKNFSVLIAEQIESGLDHISA